MSLTETERQIHQRRVAFKNSIAARAYETRPKTQETPNEEQRERAYAAAIRASFAQAAGLRRRPDTGKIIAPTLAPDVVECRASEAYAGLDVFPTIKDVMDVCCDYYRMDRLAMISKRRTRELARPRHMVMFMGRAMTAYSLPHIGRMLGNRDHTTILHGCRKIQNLLTEDPGIAVEIECLRLRITARTAARMASAQRRAGELCAQAQEIFLAESMRGT